MFAILFALSVNTPAAVPDDKDKPLPEAAQKELKKLEAKWKAVKIVVGGNEQEAGRVTSLEFKGRQLFVHENDKATAFFEVAAIDPSTTPKLLDLKALVDEGPITKGTVFETIYKLDGDDLCIAIYFGAGKKRPEKFESEKESMVVVVTLKREKN